MTVERRPCGLSLHRQRLASLLGSSLEEGKRALGRSQGDGHCWGRQGNGSGDFRGILGLGSQRRVLSVEPAVVRQERDVMKCAFHSVYCKKGGTACRREASEGHPCNTGTC